MSPFFLGLLHERGPGDQFPVHTQGSDARQLCVRLVAATLPQDRKVADDQVRLAVPGADDPKHLVTK